MKNWEQRYKLSGISEDASNWLDALNNEDSMESCPKCDHHWSIAYSLEENKQKHPGLGITRDQISNAWSDFYEHILKSHPSEGLAHPELTTCFSCGRKQKSDEKFSSFEPSGQGGEEYYVRNCPECYARHEFVIKHDLGGMRLTDHGVESGWNPGPNEPCPEHFTNYQTSTCPGCKAIKEQS